LDAFVTVNYL